MQNSAEISLQENWPLNPVRNSQAPVPWKTPQQVYLTSAHYQMIPDPKKSLDTYARYSSMAIQMLVIILAGVFGGFKLDQWLQTKPVFTVIFSVAAVILSIYFIIRDLLKK